MTSSGITGFGMVGNDKSWIVLDWFHITCSQTFSTKALMAFILKGTFRT